MDHEGPIRGERPWRDWELLVLRLMRQLPRDNIARLQAEQFIFDHGSGPEMALRGPDSSLGSPLPFVCEKCGGNKHHTRLKGYRCSKCD